MDVVGHSLARVDGYEKVTGAARFVGDIALPRMAFATLIRSPFPHARINGIDVSRAVSMSGVRAVLTGEDCGSPRQRYGPIVRDRPILAVNEVRYYGEPVAAVVAADMELASEAAEQIRVEYDELPAVLDVCAARRRGAALVHSAVDDADDAYFPVTGRDLGKNICASTALLEGEPDAAFAHAHLVVEGRYSFPSVYHYAVEPFCALAMANAKGISVWSSCQHPYQVRQDIADLFDLPLAQVRVVSAFVGGGFGSKSFTHIEPIVVALARKAGVPVRLELNLQESMLTGRRHGAEIAVRTALDRNGLLVAHEVDMDLDGGAYAHTGPLVAAKAAWRSLGAYRIPAYRVAVRCFYTHTSPAGSYRAIGGPQAAWALESHMQEVADRLGLTGSEFRRRNLAQRGERFRRGRKRLDADTEQLLALTRVDQTEVQDQGVAVTACDPGARALSTSSVRLLADGSAVVHAGTVEIGQGARTVMGQIAAEVLHLPLESVSVCEQDTDSTPFDTSTGASRSTTMMGTAVARAAADVIAQLTESTAEWLGCRPEDIQLHGGRAVIRGTTYSYAQLMRLCFRARGGEILGRGTLLDAEFAEEPFFWEVAAACAAVRVDVETGQVSVTRYASAADVGVAINPRLLEGQEEGAVIQGVGHSLFECLHWSEGQLMNTGLIDYRVPRFSDIPDQWASCFVEHFDGPGPFGAKGAGEGAIVPVAPAIANALKRSTGVRFYDLPLTPERVWLSLRNRV